MKNQLKEQEETPVETSARKGLPDGFRRITIIINEKSLAKLKETADRRGSKLYLIIYDAFKKYLEFFGC